MSTDKVTPITRATSREQGRQHASSRIAGRLLSIFDQIAAVIRDAQERAEDEHSAAMREIGGIDITGSDGLLAGTLEGVCKAAQCAMNAAEPEEAARIKCMRKTP